MSPTYPLTPAERLAAVRALHVEQPSDLGPYCDYCRDADGQPASWPCRTVQIIDAPAPTTEPDDRVDQLATRLLAEARAGRMALIAEAHASVATAISITGRQVPYDLQETAGQLLAGIWRASDRYWVQPEDWAAVTALPTACLDVLVAVERRPRTDES